MKGSKHYSGYAIGLNPCCNGIYSMRKNVIESLIKAGVLILVVMEYTQ